MRAQIRISFCILVLAISAGCNRKPKSPKDQVSYTIGVQFGKSLKTQKLDIDTSVLARGLVDGYKGEGVKLTEDEMQTAMMKMSEEKQKEMKEDSAKNKIAADEFMLNNKDQEGVKTTASGLQYKIISQGTGASPKPDDVVAVNYKGTLIDGTEFDSSYKRNMPAEFPVKGVIPGWTEGLQLMKKGGKAVFYVPPQLGYGERARAPIPGNAVLIFDVELLDIKPNQAKQAAPKKK